MGAVLEPGLMLQSLLEYPMWLFLLKAVRSNISSCLGPIERSSQTVTEEV